MFHSITWQQFGTFAGISLLVYWLFIGFVYYRKDVLALLSGRRSKEAQPVYGNPGVFEAPEEQVETPPFSAPYETDDKSENIGLFPVAYQLADEIKFLLRDAGKRRLIRQELIQAIRSLVAKDPYYQLADTGFQAAINNLIETEARTQCSYELRPEELQMIWAAT